MSFIFYKQPDKMDCGPTCLRMIAKHYGRNISLQSLREKTQIDKEGVSLLGIAEAAEQIGFRTQALKLSYSKLVQDVQLPAILFWNESHFVVLYRIKKVTIFRRKTVFCIADPAKGLINYADDEFKTQWVVEHSNDNNMGILLILQPTQLLRRSEDEDSSTSKDLTFESVFGYALPYKKLIFQLLTGLAVGSLLQLAIPFLAKSVIDVGVNGSDINFIYLVLLAQMALFLGRMTVEFIRGWILLHISTRVNLSILTDFLIKLMKLPVSFFDSKQTGDILQRINDHQRIESFLTGSSLGILFSLVNLLVFSVVLAIFSTNLFLIFALFSIAHAFWVILFQGKRRMLDHKRFHASSQSQSATIQLVQGMQEIKVQGIEQQMRGQWERIQSKLFGLSMKRLALNQWQQIGASVINESKNIVITFLTAKAVIDGQLTLGSMLAVQYILGQLNSPIEQMVSFIQSWQNAKISMERLNEVHGLEDEEPTGTKLQHELPIAFSRQMKGGGDEGRNMNLSDSGLLEAIDEASFNRKRIEEENLKELPVSEVTSSPGGSIVIENLSFTYPGAGNVPVLKNINLEIPRGKTTAIVGVSGSGKTTLLKLLLKFYTPQSGDIKLHNTSLYAISHRIWRRRCGVVMQDSFIFSDTIARNIAINAGKIEMARLRLSAQMANVREFIESLPMGYNTKIGVEGHGISMGQRQRILIARSIYRDPDFIFFDEATNSLDTNNEAQIVQNLEAFFKGRTVVVVAHRLSTVKNADQIVVLERGEIIESGTHQTLIQLKGEYYRLVKNQLELD